MVSTICTSSDELRQHLAESLTICQHCTAEEEVPRCFSDDSFTAEQEVPCCFSDDSFSYYFMVQLVLLMRLSEVISST